MHELILVGIDHSPTARVAAQAAARLAAATGAALHIVTAFDRHELSTIGVGSDANPVASAEDAKALVDSMADELRSVTPLITSSSVLGKPQQVLVGEAERRSATMIVVGNRRMQGIGRVLGSVANWVVHHAPCDVYIVKTV